jgi:hypothetical protein
MTRRATPPQAAFERAIKAAHKQGLRVVGIRPDGTVLTAEANDPHPLIPSPEPADTNEDWEVR